MQGPNYFRMKLILERSLPSTHRSLLLQFHGHQVLWIQILKGKHDSESRGHSSDSLCSNLQLHLLVFFKQKIIKVIYFILKTCPILKVKGTLWFSTVQTHVCVQYYYLYIISIYTYLFTLDCNSQIVDHLIPPFQF